MSFVFFAINILAFIAAGVSIFMLTSGRSKEKAAKLKRFSLGCMGVMLLMAVLDICGISGMSGYRFVSLWGIAASGIALGINEIKTSEKFSGLLKFASRSLMICAAAELFVFNMNSAHLLSSKYERKDLDLSSAAVVGFDPSSGRSTGGEAIIEFTGIEMPVGTLTIDAESDTSSTAYFAIDITDETYSQSYRYDIAEARIVTGYERTNTVPCNFSGNVHNLRIRFSPGAGETITIKNIAVNVPIKLRFSAIRFLLMFLGSLAVYALSSERLLRRPYKERKRAVNSAIWAFTAFLICGSLFITNMSRYNNPNHSIAADFKSTEGNQITQEIVDAFENGRLYLWECEDEALLALENPYDGSQRAGIGDSSPWDHLLYEGKIYSYYGIAPVLALFLPYYELTGYYFPAIWAAWLFGVLGIIFLTKMWLCFADKFFRETHGSLIVMGAVIMQASTGIFFNFFNPNFYEIAQTSGFLCVTGGAFFLISSGVIGEGKINKHRLAISGIFLSMGVLCRPTLAVYCLAAMLFIFAGFMKMKSGYTGGSKVKYYASYLICALLPYVLIGSVQMWYNYARFGSVLDFGIQYSLTINDFTNAEYHTHFALIGFFSYLLAMPRFIPEFPFFSADYTHTFVPQGYYFVATGATLGLLWRAAPILAYFKSRRAYRLTENKHKKLYALLIFAVCIACPFAVIFSIWESGYGTRYCVDFAWQLIIGALIICYIVHGRSSKEVRRHTNSAMIIATAVSLVMNFIQVYSYYPPELFNREWQANVIAFTRLFEFWR